MFRIDQGGSTHPVRARCLARARLRVASHPILGISGTIHKLLKPVCVCVSSDPKLPSPKEVLRFCSRRTPAPPHHTTPTRVHLPPATKRSFHSLSPVCGLFQQWQHQVKRFGFHLRRLRALSSAQNRRVATHRRFERGFQHHGTRPMCAWRPK